MLKMALFILSLLIPLSLLIQPSSAGCGITTYWGTNSKEGSLEEACSKTYPDYQHIAIAFLTAAGGTPSLNLGGHCDAALGSCKKLAKEIEFCQRKGVKVLLSLDSSFGKYPADDAEPLADYLHDNFLSGKPGPLGKVVLDGVDLYINKPGSHDFWVALCKALNKYNTENRQMHLSAAVPAPSDHEPVYNNTIATGLLNYLQVQFYNSHKYDIRSGVSGLLAAWKKWSLYLKTTSPDTQLFMGLPASPEAASPGSYIYPCVLIPHILPEIKKSPNFGGVMVWNRYYDAKSSYSQDIITPLCGLKSNQGTLLHQVV